MSFINTLSDAFTVVFVHAKAETTEEIAAAAEKDRDEAAWPGPIEVRRIGLDKLLPALMKGFDDLRYCRTDALTIAAIYPLCGLLVAGVIADRQLVPFLFPACAGFALIGPLATLWYAALSRQRELTGTAGAEETMHVFRGPRKRTLKVLGAIAICLFLAWNGAAAIIYELTLGSSTEEPNVFFLDRVLTTGAGWRMIVIGCGVGAVFAFITVAIGCFSFPLAMDRPVTTMQAIRTSLTAMRCNPLFILCWSAVIVAGLVLGALPGLIGLAVTVPVLGHATWHIYRNVVA